MAIDNVVAIVSENIVFLVFVHAALHARAEIIKIWREAMLYAKIQYGKVPMKTKVYLGTAAAISLVIAVAPALYYGQIAMSRFVGVPVVH